MKSKNLSKLIILCAIFGLGFLGTTIYAKQQQKNNDFKTAPGIITIDSQRYYHISIPDNLIGAFYNVINGNEKAVSLADYKELMPLLISQVLTQSNQFHIQDSIAQSKIKTDTTKPKK